MSVVAVLGPTAAGKSDLALRLAEDYNAEIVSVDSMQVYRGMDIGTAKPDAAIRMRIPHHLIDLVDPSVPYTVAEFARAGAAALEAIAARRLHAVVAGGSGLHFRALVDPLDFAPTDPEMRRRFEALEPDEAVRRLVERDPDAAAVVDLANPRRVVRALEVYELTGLAPSQRARSDRAVAVREYRPEVPFTAVGFDPGPGLRSRIVRRFDAMLAAGLLDEVAGLAPRLGVTARQAVGYKELLPVVSGDASLDEARAAAIGATAALAKRQRTFFRRDPRIRWLPWDDDPDRRYAAVRSVLEEANAWSL